MAGLPLSLQPTQVVVVRLPSFICRHHHLISEGLNKSLNPSELQGHLFYGGVMIVLAFWLPCEFSATQTERVHSVVPRHMVSYCH